jgi:hypothetical protein
MSGVKHIGFCQIFIFTKFTNQFRKLKSGDSQMKFITKQASSVIVGAGTLYLIWSWSKFVILAHQSHKRTDSYLCHRSRDLKI